MLLRPRQKVFVERSLAALRQHGNTLGVAPTGAGKTIMLSGVAGQWLGDTQAKACVLAHRDELTRQNEAKFRRVNPALTTSVFDAREKSWAGQTTFAMVQTLGREANLRDMPALDLLVVDEAHHAAAPIYRRIIDRVRERNPEVAIFGVTATPNRGDRKGLRPVFSNVADQITLAELIQSGHLVPPRTFVVDVGTQNELSQVKRTADDFDMTAVEAIMNKAPITEAVIRHWREKASGRPTVVFCSTVSHARSVAEAFTAAGIGAELIHGDLTPEARQAALARFETGESQVVVNVAVLTEGWDHPPTSCVVLLRPSSFKSTLIQMIGRGLRTVDPNEYPGVNKSDCIVLDFGTSTLLHGSLEQDVNLDGHEGSGEAPRKECPECGALVPVACRECSLCGHVWERSESEGRVDLTDFVMSEIDLLKRSSFRWCDLFGDDAALMATGFEAWAGVFFLSGQWYGVGGGKGLTTRLLAAGERTVCLAAADDWLNEHESEDTARKSRTWLNQPASAAQLRYLPPAYRQDFGLTRYQASCLLAFQFNKREIQSRIFAVAERKEAA
ncbi:helicase [Marinobacter lutaoensis]|jgi:superfamily II DNA or RNA helicase|uniref:Helicase n=1 Tax=Marinobacter lutaoensis TaxID=135739 RepID=A0A1V2DS39_9GAMM|nr:DEAD/DEAH box helicase [Marinobacter lutaoensis]ONF43300.1 helicase [Marinobacter lutaoensis]